MHGAGTPTSSWHSKVTPASVSVNEKLALVEAVGLAGVEVIDGAGGAVRSIVQWYSTWFETFPAASTASTWRVWLPAARPGKLAGFEHGV